MALKGIIRYSTCNQESFLLHKMSELQTLQFQRWRQPRLRQPQMKLSTNFIPRALKKVRGFTENSAQYEWLYKSQALVGSGRCIKSKLGIMRAASSLHKIFLDSKCNTEGFLYVDVQNKGDQDWTIAFYSNHSHGSDGVIVATENFKERDKNVSGKASFPSEVLWQSYLIATEDTRASPANLKLIIRHFIVNEATLPIIRQAEEKSTSTGLKSPDLGGRVYHRQDAG